MEGHAHDCWLFLEPKMRLPSKSHESKSLKYKFLSSCGKSWFNYSKWLSVSFVSARHPILVWKSVDVHRLRASKFLGCEGYLPEFSKLACNVLWDFAYKISAQMSEIMKTIFGKTPKKSSCVFLEMLGAIFWNQTTLGPILPKLSAILLEFSTNQNFCGGLAPPPPMSLDVL